MNMFIALILSFYITSFIFSIPELFIPIKHALDIISKVKNTLRNLAFVLSTIYTIIWSLYSLGV